MSPTCSEFRRQRCDVCASEIQTISVRASPCGSAVFSFSCTTATPLDGSRCTSRRTAGRGWPRAPDVMGSRRAPRSAETAQQRQLSPASRPRTSDSRGLINARCHELHAEEMSPDQRRNADARRSDRSAMDAMKERAEAESWVFAWPQLCWHGVGTIDHRSTATAARRRWSRFDPDGPMARWLERALRAGWLRKRKTDSDTTSQLDTQVEAPVVAGHDVPFGKRDEAVLVDGGRPTHLESHPPSRAHAGRVCVCAATR